MKTTLAVILTLFLGSACSREAEPVADAAPNAAPAMSVYEAAIASESRTDTDQERDANRKPDEVLAFFGIQPGMDVLDMFSGGGYYTEIVSRIVGPEGSVHAHNNSAYAQFVGEETTNRYADDRLANVEFLMAENNELDLSAESFDAILMILAYHDIYYVAPNDGWPRIDGPKLIAEFYKGLRPGGILGVVDHVAAAGSARETGNTLHRIDPEIVIEELEAAGFVLEDKSDVLRNRDDDHDLSMAAAEIRGRTDRFVLR
ncbi:MAG: methyltransferase domain-containing protein, partial [Gammaproteobacteria bacterium]|nr:methyltransferase domain-containing protein [Gammaproteobacteria bacterium]